MMYIQKNNKSTLRYSKMRSSSVTLLPKKKSGATIRADGKPGPRVKTALSSPIKPSCVSKRSVSLPSNLRKNSVKTRKLFWFVPKAEETRKRRWAEERIVASVPEIENQQDVRQEGIAKIPESVALEWITSSSTHSLSDSSESSEESMDDEDDDLFGLEFVDATTETDHKH